MPISFEKRLTQDYCYNIAEGHRAAAPDHKYNFKDYELTAADCTALAMMALKDALGLYYNALVSFGQGCHSILAGCASWACVELYYSLFYALRAELYYNGYALIRDRGLYLLKIAEGEHPVHRSNKEYNTDHGGTLRYYIDTYGASDYLSSNQVDGMNVYMWMMDVRETTNYRHKCFNEPESFVELTPLITQIKSDGIIAILRRFKEDFSTYCFSNQHAWICAPYYKLLEVAAMYKAGSERLSAEQKTYLVSVFQRINLDDEEVKDLMGGEDKDEEEGEEVII